MRALIGAVVCVAVCAGGVRGGGEPLELIDVFALEYASDPRISPDGSRVAYVRRSGDVMKDRFRSEIWMVGVDGTGHRALVQGEGGYGMPRWSPGGDRILYTASEGGRHELRVLWLDTRESMVVAALESGVGSAAWSPDGSMVALSMFVREEGGGGGVDMPRKPEGATWADPAVVIDRVLFRADGRGFLEQGSAQIFVVPSDGGTPRRLTEGAFDHKGPLSWTPDGGSVVFTSNRAEEWERDPLESDVYEVAVGSGEIRRLTDRDGPDEGGVVSPDGRWVACVGFDDREQGYQVDRLTVVERATGRARVLTGDLDRSVRGPVWAGDSGSVYVLLDDHGVTKAARVSLEGGIEIVAEGIGGATLGRPYPSGSLTVGPGGVVATVVTSAVRPADVAVVDADGVRRLTALNEDVLGHTSLSSYESMTVRSSADGLEVQAWVMRPPGFEAGVRYPLVLEIHGGPFANYGERFSAEMQLFAAAGYVVVYANPRGSTSYGESFGNAIHHAYPSEDYDDLMSVVDAVVGMGIVDEDRMFVTGGSGGGVLTAWIVGKTDRFRAAVVAKPVINWVSHVLTADMYTYFTRYWFPGPAWEHHEHYWARSPLSLVGSVTTPTMLLTGEEDLRTPIAESEQYYQALQLRRVPTRLVRIPGASHGIAARPSGLVSKVAHILGWFEEHGGGDGDR